MQSTVEQIDELRCAPWHKPMSLAVTFSLQALPFIQALPWKPESPPARPSTLALMRCSHQVTAPLCPCRCCFLAALLNCLEMGTTVKHPGALSARGCPSNITCPLPPSPLHRTFLYFPCSWGLRSASPWGSSLLHKPSLPPDTHNSALFSFLFIFLIGV